MADHRHIVKKGILAGGVSAALLAAAGAYFLYASPKGKSRRKKLEGWMHSFSDEVVTGLKRSEKWNKGVFEKLVDAAETRYTALKNIDPEQLRELARGIKKQWVTFSKIVSATKPSQRGGEGRQTRKR